MRRTVVIILDLEDNSEEGSNWLVDTIALENTIRDSLNDGAIVHDISVTLKDE